MAHIPSTPNERVWYSDIAPYVSRSATIIQYKSGKASWRQERMKWNGSTDTGQRSIDLAS